MWQCKHGHVQRALVGFLERSVVVVRAETAFVFANIPVPTRGEDWLLLSLFLYNTIIMVLLGSASPSPHPFCFWVLPLGGPHTSPTDLISTASSLHFSRFLLHSSFKVSKFLSFFWLHHLFGSCLMWISLKCVKIKFCWAFLGKWNVSSSSCCCLCMMLWKGMPIILYWVFDLRCYICIIFLVFAPYGYL